MTGANQDIAAEAADSSVPDRRLNSWKEIGAYFGKDERTAKRWETQRGLPVHRLPGGARTTVFAFTAELDQWLRNGRAKPAAATEATVELVLAIPTFAAVAGPSAADRGWQRALAVLWPWPVAGIAAVLIVGAVGTAALLHPTMTAIDGKADAPATITQAPPAEAVDLYLRGTYQWNARTPESLRKASELFDAAIARDPTYAAAYVGRANTYNLLSQYTDMPPATAYPIAKAAAERALQLDPQSADAYAALAFNAFYWSHDITRAGELFRKSLAIDPDQSRTLHWYALVMMHTGDFAEPLRAISRAQQLAPDSRAILANKGLITFYAGRTDEALGILVDLSAAAPDFLPPHFYLASIYLDLGRYGDFLRESLEATRLGGDERAHAMYVSAARAFDQGGAPAMLAEMLAQQTARYASGAEKAFNVARTAAVLGERQLALDYLHKSMAAAEPDLVGILVDPMLKSLRTDDDFRTIAHAVF